MLDKPPSSAHVSTRFVSASRSTLENASTYADIILTIVFSSKKKKWKNALIGFVHLPNDYLHE